MLDQHSRRRRGDERTGRDKSARATPPAIGRPT
jgi:hypothetical protein